jgi:hypothetical protein
MWVQAISIAFTKTYALLNRSTAPGCGPELLHSTLLGVLQLVAGLSSRGQMGLAAELAGCCRYSLYINCCTAMVWYNVPRPGQQQPGVASLEKQC